MIDLRLGNYADVLTDVTCDLLCVDAPYSARTHEGHNRGVTDRRMYHGEAVSPRATIDYSRWTPADVDVFVDFWAPRTRGWMVSLTDDVLLPHWKAAMSRHGRVTFQNVPAIISGMTVRLAGDGPSSWAINCVVSRPKALSKWGTLPGGYFGPEERQFITGGKPLWLMRALIRDYSRFGDVVCDPCCGGATTLRAAQVEGRQIVGSELDATTHAKALSRLEKPFAIPLVPDVRPEWSQPDLLR